MKGPIATGVMLAAAAAFAFGVTTPVIAWAGRATGPLSTAALLYAGAAVAALLMSLRAHSSGTRLARCDTPWLVGMAVAGAVVAPTCLAWGLVRAGATAGSLVLNLEAVVTVLLAWIIFREPLGRRVLGAVLVMVGAGVLLVLDSTGRGGGTVLGAFAIGGATIAWGVDNTLSRRLAERDPLQVIVVKGLLGAMLTTTLAVAWGEPLPTTTATLALLGCGATGYGVSLRLYLLAQRAVGAARTGSVFALAPFVGAAIAWMLGDRDATVLTLIAAGGFAVGVYLHVSEKHGHEHAHEATEHAHAHRHDDDHHDHRHEPPVAGAHTHTHVHARVVHAHDHAPDVHHDHRH